jgi:SET domain-containing protein
VYKWFHGAVALPLGLGSIFNHSSDPNTGFMRDQHNRCIRYITLRDIAKDDELCISYGESHKLWFMDEDEKSNGLDAGGEEEEEGFFW